MGKTRVEELLKELRGATQNRKMVRILLELAEEFFTIDAIVAQDYAKQALTCARRGVNKEDLAESLVKYARCLIRTNSLEEVSAILVEAKELNAQLGNVGALGHIANSFGNVSHIKGDYVAAMKYYTESAELLEQAGDQNKLEMVLGNIGLIYRNIGDYSKAFHYTSKSLELSLSLGKDSSAGYLNIGILYWEILNYDRAKEYLQKAEEGFQKSSDALGIVMCYLNIGCVDSVEGNSEAAIGRFNQGLEIARYQDFYPQQIKILEQLGLIYQTLGDFNACLRNFDEAIEVTEKHGIQTHTASLLGYKASTLIKNSNYREAKPILQKALTLSQQHQELFNEVEIHKLLADCYIHEKKYKEATEQLMIHFDLQEKVQKNNQNKLMVEAHIRLEIEQAMVQREEFRRQREQMAIELAAKQKELTAIALQMAKQNEMLGKLTEQLRTIPTGGSEDKRKASAILYEIDRMRNNDSDWRMFENQFDSIHAGFNTSLLEQYPILTPKEVRICALMRLNLSSKDIANTLAISPRTVEVHRLTIRKKMKLKQADNLATHLAAM